MKKIDDDLGGTTPLNVILKFPVKETKLIKSKDDNFDEWEDENENEDKAKYWFTRDKMDKIIKVHEYLESFQKSEKCSLLGQFLK